MILLMFSVFYGFSENTAVVGSPYLVEQEDAKAAVENVSIDNEI